MYFASFCDDMERWPCHFPLNYWRRYFAGAQHGVGGMSCGFIMGKNTSEGSWHSNAQSLKAWAVDRGEGWRRNAQSWNGTKIHHTCKMESSPFQFKASPSPRHWLAWQWQQRFSSDCTPSHYTACIIMAAVVKPIVKPTINLNHFQLLLKIFNRETNCAADMRPIQVCSLPRMSKLCFD